MAKCRKLRNAGRTKLLFGSEEAAILGAAAITAGATTAGAIMQKNATINAAQQQAEQMRQSAKLQADGLKEQNELAKAQQEEQLEFVKSQNEQQRDIEKQMLAQMAIVNGQQNMIDRQESSKIKFRNGGSLYQRFPLRGRNSKLSVIDGGYLMPIGYTPEGYKLNMAIGNDHEHYHKTNGGKYKSGVGLRLNNGKEIEVEGNQSSPVGELVLETPNDIIALSKHSLKGYNPTKDVLYNGTHPLVAANIQNQIKNKYNIGNSSNNRTKARNGMLLYNLGASGLNALGNLAGGFITTAGNKRAGQILSDAYSESGRILAEGYKNLKGIDLSLIDEKSYVSPNALAVVRAPISNTRGAIAADERSLMRKYNTITNNSLSGAATQRRLATAEVDSADNRNRIYSAADAEAENIKQQNAQTITRTGISNAERLMRGKQNYTNAYLEGMKYNAGVRNESILGQSKSLAEGLTNSSEARAMALTRNAEVMGNTLSAVGSDFASGLRTYAQYKHDTDLAMLAASESTQLRYEYSNMSDKELNNRVADYDLLSEQEQMALDAEINRRGNLRKIKPLTTTPKVDTPVYNFPSQNINVTPINPETGQPLESITTLPYTESVVKPIGQISLNEAFPQTRINEEIIIPDGITTPSPIRQQRDYFFPDEYIDDYYTPDWRKKSARTKTSLKHYKPIWAN